MTASTREFPYTVKVAATIDGTSARLDFTGTDSQVAAAVNSSISQSLAGAVFAFRCFLDPTIPMNDGSLRVLDVHLPEGSLLNATSPYPCGGRFLPAYAAMECVLQALSDAVPEHGHRGIRDPATILDRRDHRAVLGSPGLRVRRGGRTARQRRSGRQRHPLRPRPQLGGRRSNRWRCGAR